MTRWFAWGLALGLLTLCTACNGSGVVVYRGYYGPGPWGPYWGSRVDRTIVVVPPPDRRDDLVAVPPIHYPEGGLETIPPVEYPDIDMGMPDIDFGVID